MTVMQATNNLGSLINQMADNKAIQMGLYTQFSNHYDAYICKKMKRITFTNVMVAFDRLYHHWKIMDDKVKLLLEQRRTK